MQKQSKLQNSRTLFLEMCIYEGWKGWRKHWKELYKYVNSVYFMDGRSMGDFLKVVVNKYVLIFTRKSY